MPPAPALAWHSRLSVTWPHDHPLPCCHLHLMLSYSRWLAVLCPCSWSSICLECHSFTSLTASILNTLQGPLEWTCLPRVAFSVSPGRVHRSLLCNPHRPLQSFCHWPSLALFISAFAAGLWAFGGQGPCYLSLFSQHPTRHLAKSNCDNDNINDSNSS